MNINLTEVERTASEFKSASDEIELIYSRLDERMEQIEKIWDPASAREFGKLYKEWRVQIGELAETLDEIGGHFAEINQSLHEADS